MVENIFFVVIAFNQKEDTYNCIESLYNAGARLEQVIIVDNASTDGSVLFLREKYGSEIQIIESKENKGYAFGANLGIKMAIQKSANWILLMNNDTIVDPSFVNQMMIAVESSEGKYAIFGPLILFYSLPTKIWYLGDRLIPGTLFTQNPYFMKELPANTPGVLPVDFLNGCAMMIHRTVFEKIGFFDTYFFMYGEEVDFCWRARQAGFKLAGVSSAKMWHKISASSNQNREISQFLRVRNQICFYRRYSNTAQIIIMFFMSFIRNIFLALKFLVDGFPKLSLAVMNGWKEGWFSWKQ